MAILISDDEASTRGVLRELIESLGLGPVLEARNGKEASQLSEQQKSRIELIISDREMPEKDGLSFLEDVSANPALDHVPFLLITSEEIEAPKGRLDGILLKPFQLEKLRRALIRASAARAVAHPVALFFGTEALLPVRDTLPRCSHWTEIADVLPGQSLEKASEPVQRKLGALFFEPGRVSEEDLRWLAQFKKTPAGARVQVVCVADSQASAQPARIGPDHFAIGAFSRNDWNTLVSRLAARATSALEQEICQKEYRAGIQAKDFAAAQSLAEKLLKLDPRNSDYTMWLAKCLESRGKKRDALEQYCKAVELNPFNSPAKACVERLASEAS
jgi:CheY-like chemotaxis protein